MPAPEPREVSPLEFYSAQRARTEKQAVHNAHWPGVIEEITATEPTCTLSRKYAARKAVPATTAACREPYRGPRPHRRFHAPSRLYVILLLVVLLCLGIFLSGISLRHGALWIAAKVFVPSTIQEVGNRGR